MASAPFIALALITMSMLVSMSLAQPPFGYPPPLQIPSGGGATNIQECTAALVNTGGCYFEILRAFGATGSSQGGASFTIGPVCCKAVQDISATCWSRLFPYDPFFPPMVQNYCARYKAGPYAAPAPAM